MSEHPSRPSSPHLEPPRKSFELEDPGAQGSMVSNSEDEHFSDASEGHERSHSRSPSSPVPRTRVEKVDGSPSHGEVPGTDAYETRTPDAVPDEVDVVPEGCRSRSQSSAGLHDRPSASEESPVPQTLVEKVDPDVPSHGEVPGTAAFEQRKADAVPDLVMRMSEHGESRSPSLNPSPSRSSSDDTPVPETRLSRVDSLPSDTDSGVQAHRRSPSDASPDTTERVSDPPDPSTSLQTSPTNRNHTRRRSTLTKTHDDTLVDRTNPTAASMNPEAADEFDDFAEEQDEMGEDDFGDFDDGFQGPGEVAAEEAMDQGSMQPQQPATPPPVPPLVDLDTPQSFPDLCASLDPHLDALFPASKETSSLPPVDPIPNSSAIFSTDRSLSLWSQLVAPPPLQPQNWVKSRIRRLFLVSLGVPVDLDEILPASKQKKLVLPSINADGTPTDPSDPHAQNQPGPDGSQGRTASPATASRQRQPRRGNTSPPPELDLSAVRRLCLTTDAALDGLTDPELEAHIRELERTTQRAGTVLEYWLRRRDGLVGEKEAFEGVIENLVSHARRVRK